MNLFPALEKKYSKEQLSAAQAQRLAQEIVFGPVVFQVARLMVKWGLFEMLGQAQDGLSLDEMVARTGRPRYVIQVLLESSLTSGTVLLSGDRFELSKTGWFLLNDTMARVNMDFNHDVNYLGLFRLEEALEQGTPEGLKVFGSWPTIYEGLSSLPEQVQKAGLALTTFLFGRTFSPKR
jgi:hypothetical protein